MTLYNCGSDIYLTYPFPFRIAMVNSVFYAGGKYHYMAADQFVSDGTLEAHNALLWADRLPDGHNCQTCAKVCRNLTVSGFCCDWEERDGLNVTGREEFNESNNRIKSDAVTGIPWTARKQAGKVIGEQDEEGKVPEKPDRPYRFRTRLSKMLGLWGR